MSSLTEARLGGQNQFLLMAGISIQKESKKWGNACHIYKHYVLANITNITVGEHALLLIYMLIFLIDIIMSSISKLHTSFVYSPCLSAYVKIEYFSIQRRRRYACGQGAKTWSHLSSLSHVRFFTHAHAYSRAYADCGLRVHEFPA